MYAPSPILRSYEELELLATQMLECAKASHWDAMAELQQVYLAEVERLRWLEDDATCARREHASRLRLLQRLLAHDAAIRDLVMPEWSQLGKLLSNARRQKDLCDAYSVAG